MISTAIGYFALFHILLGFIALPKFAGSLLDDDARAALEADAKANDFVVLMECVGAGDGSGIVIENGEIV